ncbi:hypothetical protein BgiBS90_014690, partial [Biomphalaria glabrata]
MKPRCGLPSVHGRDLQTREQSAPLTDDGNASLYLYSTRVNLEMMCVLYMTITQRPADSLRAGINEENGGQG